MNELDRKTQWGLLGTVMWICTRDEKRVATLWDTSEEEAMGPVLLSVKTEFDPCLLGRFAETEFDAYRQDAALQEKRQSSRVDRRGMMKAGEALDDLRRRMQSGRFRMTAIRLVGNSNEQIPVPPAEFYDLEFRISPGHPVAPVGLWSRSRGKLLWGSPQFVRADVVGAWPAQRTKTAAVVRAILRYLRQITTPEARLTKREAQQRCMAEVPNAYPEAFKKAWAQLEPSCKRGRGKHGPRAR
jgi:hypothetical protein